MRGKPPDTRRPRAPAKISAAYLRWVTERYLNRYATTTAHLRRLLRDRARRSAAYHEVDPEPGYALVDAEIARLVGLRLLDDARYAEDKARALHRRGNGGRAIRDKLAAKGLRGEVVAQALAARTEAEVDPELEAACAWARRRRLGPWAREPVTDPVLRRKQLARFGRAGFGWEVATRILAAATPEDLLPG